MTCSISLLDLTNLSIKNSHPANPTSFSYQKASPFVKRKKPGVSLVFSDLALFVDDFRERTFLSP
jgi:hypothetical protein